MKKSLAFSTLNLDMFTANIFQYLRVLDIDNP